ncbi:MAG: hypothetical protein Q7R79_00175 [bacterium]|nr:hypothetical protein [bacterium]
MIAQIIPLVRLPSHLDVFDYVVPDKLQASLSIGHIVEIPFRKKVIRGVVISLAEKSHQKKELKEISSLVLSYPLLSPKQIELNHWLSGQYSASRAVFAQMMVPPLPKRKSLLPSEDRFKTPGVQLKNSNPPSTIIRYVSLAEKLNFYRETISSVMKSPNAQILFLCPTIHHVEFLVKHLNDIFSQDIVVLHGKLSPTQYLNASIEAMTGGKRVIIGTRIAAYIHIHSLSTIIVDDADRIEHKNYDQNPRYDARDIARKRSSLEGSSLFFVSVAPRLEDFVVSHEGEDQFMEIGSLSQRIHSANLSDEWKKKNFSWVSEELIEQIENTIANKKSVFLFLNKKGSSRLVMCSDCEYIFLCTHCSLPQRYSASSNELHCSVCSETRQLPSSCPHCRSVRFKFTGVGIEKIIRFLRELFLEIPIVEWSSETSENPIIPSTPTLFVGTSLVLSTFDRVFPSVGLTAVLIADPVHHLSDFRATEYQWHIQAQLCALASFYGSSILLQAFDPNHIFISTLLCSDYTSFIQWLSESRKRFGWPPYGRLIKLIYREQVLPANQFEQVRLLCSSLPDTSFTLYHLKPTSSRTQPGILLRLNKPYRPGEDIPDTISSALRTLSENWLIDIDPVTI